MNYQQINAAFPWADVAIGRSDLAGATQEAGVINCPASLHISRRIRFSGEMWLNRLDDRPLGNKQSNSQTIAPDYYLKRDRSSCDVTFFLKVNRYKLSLLDNAHKCFFQFDSFRKHVACAAVFVKYAGCPQSHIAAPAVVLN
jgi:hypothetical protein